MDIEKAIVILKDEDCFWNSPEKDILEAIKHILAEREADKKRIKELEEENKRLKTKVDVTNWQEKTVYESLKNNYIPVQKVKDKIEELKQKRKKEPQGTVRDFILVEEIKFLEELLEEK